MIELLVVGTYSHIVETDYVILYYPSQILKMLFQLLFGGHKYLRKLHLSHVMLLLQTYQCVFVLDRYRLFYLLALRNGHSQVFKLILHLFCTFLNIRLNHVVSLVNLNYLMAFVYGASEQTVGTQQLVILCAVHDHSAVMSEASHLPLCLFLITKR